MNYKLSSINYHLSSKHAFTLMEILIVVALLVILAIALLVTLNPWAQINKGQDNKRKTELTQLSKEFEDYYNDKSCYPRPQEVCYDYNPSIPLNCHICGNETGSPSFAPYLSTLPCDPRQPTERYFYQVDNESCPSLYKIYSNLSYTEDPVISELNLSSCQYNYGVSSPNTSLDCQSDTPSPTSVPTITLAPTGPYGNACSTYASLYILSNNICNICGSYNNCKITFPGVDYYTDAGGGGNPRCTIRCIKD